MSNQQVSVEQVGPVRRIWLDRSDARNAQSREMLDQLDAALDDVEQDPDTRVVVLAGKGEHFSAGHDLKQAQAERGDISVEGRWQYEERRYFEYCMRIWDFPKATISQVQGACVAGGFMLANMCDLVVASEDAFFSDPVSHAFGAVGTEVLIHPWVMGLRQAKELLFTGSRMSARRAYDIGMVNKVVSRPELEEAAMAMAQHVAKMPPFAMKLIKKSLNRAMEVQGLKSALSSHFDLHQLGHVTDEFRQTNSAGIAAGIKKVAAAGRAEAEGKIDG